ncbi:MAG: 5-oxoprolinase subunit PxpA [Candidatus Pseudomonas phytovorans]|uniref:5-oxoprolinase subunit A n=1 Tax=Candidatus Pseudomonas phytovorans TaxID=3121377 RepID=A0AAJ6BEJ0_9PSED|nr:5-oxoprolinase subunit PxpA [Pseudomonas sp.]WEK32794.1 MAG: 5-oxoprolinase subunit PxpA [Pseudomonas sp.]
MRIDLNADLGEGFGPWKMGEDEALMDIISSANVACGFHAGDPLIMDTITRLALAKGIDLGGHVGYPDLLGFGRRPMQVDIRELQAYVTYQLGALAGMAKVNGHQLTHMSFHGALGNRVAADAELADALLLAVKAFDPQLIVSSSTSQAMERAAEKHGLRIATTFLADRAYDKHGLLVPRALPDSVIKDPALVRERVRQFLDSGTVTCYTGEVIAVPACSILLHGDNANALELAWDIRHEIEHGGGQIVPLSRLFD